MVGSYHIEDSDTTSATYEIANRAYEDAANDVFSTNIFQYNTKRTYSTGIATDSLADADKPGSSWGYRHVLPSDYNLLIGVTNTDYTQRLDFVLDNHSPGTGSTNPYLFTTEEKVHLFTTFVPDLNSIGSSNEPNRMPSFLSRLVSLHMAQNMVIELTGSENRHEILFKQYTAALKRARTLEGRSSPPQQYITDSTSSFINAHQNYGSI